MSWVFIAIAVVPSIGWLVRSDVLRSRPARIETGFPQRPQLGGYRIISPESDT
jgi:hypothetical protein